MEKHFAKKFYSSFKTRAEGGVGERVKMTKKPNEIKLLRAIALVESYHSN
jgi:hypothetical protein